MTTTIRLFHHDDRVYTHDFDLADDSCRLIAQSNIPEEEDKMLLHYSHDGKVSLNNNIIGSFHLNTAGMWYLETANGKKIESNHSIDACEGLLDFEVDISKMFIAGNLDWEMRA